MNNSKISNNDIAVIGAGISGISVSKMLIEEGKNVTLFEKNKKIGGLIKCERINDNLFHRVGGHVFNSKNKDVLTWFWKYFDKDNEFIRAKRNAQIWLDSEYIGYPIENFLHKLPENTLKQVINELLIINQNTYQEKHKNFEQVLLCTFGRTLYNLYFEPYNKKIWNCDLSMIPLDWLKGKLPMPDLVSIIMSNIYRNEESEMVHSFFYYPKENGSQFIIDRLAEGINIQTDFEIRTLELKSEKWIINGKGQFDSIVYCGDVRDLYQICKLEDSQKELKSVKDLRSNGTSAMFCETDPTDISWLYIPEAKLKAHRIIYTGTFSPDNNKGTNRMTCVVEFSGNQSLELMREEIKKLPGNLKEIDHNFEPNSYIIHSADTTDLINNLKGKLEPQKLFLLGRFAEWEYYNMDKAIERAMDVANRISN